MKTVPRRSLSSSIPGYSENAALQLIVASGVCFVSYHMADIVLKIVDAKPEIFLTIFRDNVGLPALKMFSSKFWTVLTYGWVHIGFWEMFTNMVWLYCFGSIVQMLVGYKQVIPIFIYAMIVGGLSYELAQLLPGNFFVSRPFSFGANGSVIALAVAALTIAPGYRFYLTPTFSIPLVALACIFFALIIIGSNLEGPSLFLLAGGAATGFGYIRLLQNGYKPGGWMYGMFERMERMATPDEGVWSRKNIKRNQVLDKMKHSQNLTQKRIDEILDKINQKGYNALTQEEKDVLLKAGKDDTNK